ncbi:30S ribosomal protein S12 methylthiotransferase RimO [Candidatus Laterigemmans baculatus]|uniref:30S ribosomal protein S12 methylthiotransferase RimO n=1 Tax=Candidatus Laterigemmans baculatus TaxID=2770505 RepID=UPI0013DD7274|nr:30S ribosomal protein S12 methylthiotransferase RimO [Candidatus Laterigemmans baculatus]
MQLPIVSDLPTLAPSAESGSSAESAARGRYAVISLGCPKNLVDTEQMLGRLQHDGYALTADPEGADFVVINTCGFIDAARAESFGAIDEMLQMKREGRIRGVIVSGCLAERQRDALLEERPEIDALIGVFGRDEIVAVADRLVGSPHGAAVHGSEVDGIEEQRTIFRPAPVRALPDNFRLAATPQHFAYLKISEGCDRLCTFCAIPKMRGKHASKPLEQVVAEARQLAASGVREIVVVAQDTTYYGIDLYGRPRLAELLRELDAVEGLDWIRLMYFYPMYIDDHLIDTIAGAERIVPYIDIPLQHASDAMLKRMSRRVNRADTERLLDQMRAKIDNLILRTTFITGFPGETDADFAELVDFVNRQQFERLGVFTYSFEPDTPAARLPNHVDEAVKEERREALMHVQQKIAFDRNASLVGQTLDFIIDAPLEEQPGVWLGRSFADAPDVDGVSFISETGEHALAAGQMVGCEVVASQGYDLVAVPVAEPR